MSTIVLRSVKGTPLTNTEVDNNFTNLNTDKIEIGGTYSSGAASGVLFLNSSKVLTTGSALTFDGTNLSTTGRVIVSGSAGTSDISLGTYSGGAWLNTPSATVGYLAVGGSSAFRWDASNLVGYIGGSEQMRLTSTGLGIGTSSPAFKLDVGGQDGTNIALRSTGTSAARFRAYVNSAESGVIGFLNGGGQFFEVAGTEAMRLTSTGLGIGTSSPGGKLELYSGASGATAFTNGANLIIQNSSAVGMSLLAPDANACRIYFGTASNNRNAYIYSDYNSGAQTLIFGVGTGTTAASEKMRLDTSGNLGLGVTPSAWAGKAFQIGNASNSGWASIGYDANGKGFFATTAYNNSGSSWTYTATGFAATLYSADAGSHKWFNAPSGTAGNAISFTQAMTLDASGSLLVGTTSNAISGNQVGTSAIFAASGTLGGVRVANTGNDIAFSRNGTNYISAMAGSSSFLQFGAYNGISFATGATPTERMRLDSSGNLGLGVTPSAWSGSQYNLQIAGSQNIVFNDQYGSLGSNYYYASSAYRYIQSSQSAAKYTQAGGVHQWYTAPSGTAGAAISFTQAMTLDASGNLLVGGTSASGRFTLTTAEAKAQNATPFVISTTDASNKFELIFARATNSSYKIQAVEQGVAYRDIVMQNDGGNLGIGTSSPAFKLQVIGASQIQANAAGTQQVLQLNNSDTTAGTQAVKLGFSSAGSTKASINAAVYGNDYMTFNVGSDTERMRLDASGNLGIGTSSPVGKLGVKGQSVFAASGTPAYFLESTDTITAFSANGSQVAIRTWQSGVASALIGHKASDSNLYITNTYAGNALGSNGLALDSSGNLGLGVTPSAWSGFKALQINYMGIAATGAGSGDGSISWNAYNNGTNWLYGYTGGAATRYRQNESGHAWYTAPSGTAGNAISFTQAMTLDASGNLLLGGTSVLQSAKITAYGSVSAQNGGVDGTFANAFVGVYSGNSNEHNAIQTAVSSFGAGSGFRFRASLGGGSSSTYPVLDLTRSQTIFYTDNTERVRIDSSGNLLVGTTTAEGVGQTLYPSGLYVNKYSGTSGTHIQFLNNNGVIGSISSSGTTTAYNTSSDYRLKEDIQPMTGALAKVAALKPCTYKWKVDGSDGEGFIAHELAEIVPQCVTGEKDAVDADGNPVYQGIDTSFLVATLTAAIQEQQAIITDLRARVAALEAA